MLVEVCQRWSSGHGSFRPAHELIDPRRFEVAALSRADARAFVTAHHYAGASYPAARFQYGLFERGRLVGAAVFSHPVNNATLRPLPGEGLERTELGRFVLLDEVKGNGESWFLARAFELLRAEGIVSVVSFSDPEPRTALDGREVFAGHIGTIYKATNAVYTGRARVDTQRLLPDGSVLHSRAVAKLRNPSKPRGWKTARDHLERFGATPLGENEDAQAWADLWIPRLTRSRRHQGNHRYLFGLTRAAKRALPVTLKAAKLEAKPYPKLGAAA